MFSLHTTRARHSLFPEIWWHMLLPWENCLCASYGELGFPKRCCNVFLWCMGIRTVCDTWPKPMCWLNKVVEEASVVHYTQHQDLPLRSFSLNGLNQSTFPDCGSFQRLRTVMVNDSIQCSWMIQEIDTDLCDEIVVCHLTDIVSEHVYDLRATFGSA